MRREAARDALLASAGSLSRQKGQLSLVLSQLDGESEVLAANVEATDVLRHFCGRAECALFGKSAPSYGRSLLYLKDQMKDLSSSVSELSRSEATVAEQITLAEQAIVAKRRERDALVAESPQAQLMAKLNALTQEDRLHSSFVWPIFAIYARSARSSRTCWTDGRRRTRRWKRFAPRQCVATTKLSMMSGES